MGGLSPLDPRNVCSRILPLGLRGRLLGTAGISPWVLTAVRQAATEGLIEMLGFPREKVRSRSRAGVGPGVRGGGSCPSDCEFPTPEELPCPSSPDCERLVHAAGWVRALRGGPQRPGGGALTCPGDGPAGARAHPEFAKGVETRSGGASPWTLGAGRCLLGSGFSRGLGGGTGQMPARGRGAVIWGRVVPCI